MWLIIGRSDGVTAAAEPGGRLQERTGGSRADAGAARLRRRQRALAVGDKCRSQPCEGEHLQQNSDAARAFTLGAALNESCIAWKTPACAIAFSPHLPGSLPACWVPRLRLTELGVLHEMTPSHESHPGLTKKNKTLKSLFFKLFKRPTLQGPSEEEEPHHVMTRHAAAVAEDRAEEAGLHFAPPLQEMPEPDSAAPAVPRAGQSDGRETPGDADALADEGMVWKLLCTQRLDMKCWQSSTVL